VIVTESGEVVVVPQGGQAPRTVQEQPGISAAPLAQGPQSDVACGQRVEHVVAPGQTLFGIANYYRSTTYSVARLNRIANVRRLSVGQRLIVLTCDRAGGAAPGGAGRRYVVRAGDNLYRIGLRYGRSAEHIRAANGLPSYQISPGQILVIP
jgi:LysM repeat protein